MADHVTSHEAWGLGSYIYMRYNASVTADRAFEVPNTPGVKLHSMVTVSLGGILAFLGDKNIALGRWIALITTAVTFGLSTLLWTEFDTTTAAIEYVRSGNLRALAVTGGRAIALPADL